MLGCFIPIRSKKPDQETRHERRTRFSIGRQVGTSGFAEAEKKVAPEATRRPRYTSVVSIRGKGTYTLLFTQCRTVPRPQRLQKLQHSPWVLQLRHVVHFRENLHPRPI